MSIVIRPSLEMKRQAGFDLCFIAKKEAPDAEALTPPRPAFCLFVCEVEPLRRKVGVAHGVQLIGGLAGQRRHFLVHVRQSCPEICRRPAAVGVVVQTDQVFFFHGEIHSSYLHPFLRILL